MFKKLLIAIVIALPLSAFAQKFGTVDLGQVFEAMPESTAMRTQITDASKKYEDEFMKLKEEMNKLYTDFQAIQNDPATPESIKERRMQEISDKEQKLQQFHATAQQELEALSQRLSAPIQQKLLEAIKSVGQEGGYTFVLPNDPGLILYAGSEVTDLTAQVKAKLGIQ